MKFLWRVRHFKTFAAQEQWITAHELDYQIERLFVNNGYAVEYRKRKWL